MRASVSLCIAGSRRGPWGRAAPAPGGGDGARQGARACDPALPGAVPRCGEARRQGVQRQPQSRPLGKPQKHSAVRRPCFAEREQKAPGPASIPASHLVCEAQLQLALPRQGEAAPQLESEP